MTVMFLTKAVYERFAEEQQGQPVQYKYYADKGYFVQSHGYAAYKGKNLYRMKTT